MQALPKLGEDLATITFDEINSAYEDVRSELTRRHLPAAIQSIYKLSPLTEADRESGRKSLDDLTVSQIARILTTFPGKSAQIRIEDLLKKSRSLESSTAEYEFAKALFDGTTSLISVQNIARHLKTSVNSHLRALGINRGNSFQYMQREGYKSTRENPLLHELLERGEELKQMTIRDLNDVSNWVNSLTSLLGDVNAFQREERIKSGEIEQGRSTFDSSVVPSAMLTAYGNRFKQAILQSIDGDAKFREGVKQLNLGPSIREQLAELNKTTELPPKSLYEELTRMMRPRIRPSSNERTMKFSMDVPSAKRMPPKKKTKTVLNLNGRKLSIESTNKAFNNEIINGTMKALKVQLIIDESPKILEAGYESEGETLRVSLEDGTIQDLKKIETILDQLG
jgi:hypothetical protein